MPPTDSYQADRPSGIATVGGPSGGETDRSRFPDSPDSGSSSSTSSASSLPALRNESGEAVWRLTEKATAYFRSLEGLPLRRVDEVRTCRCPSTVGYEPGDSAKA
jgi:hypothetical protein